MRATIVVLAVLVLSTISLCWGGSMTPPGEVNAHTKMALHLKQHWGTCKGVNLNSRNDIVKNLDSWSTDPIDGGVDAFLVVFAYDSISGADYGLDWPADWGTVSTSVCVSGAISVGDIRYPRDGITILWPVSMCKIPSNKPGGNSPPFLLLTRTWFFPTGAGEIIIRENPYTLFTAVIDCRPEQFRFEECVDSVFDAGLLMPTGLYAGPPPYGPCTSPRLCSVYPTYLDFGRVPVGTSSDKVFTMHNAGFGQIAGTVGEVCEAYSIVGDTAYYLMPGQSKVFTVRFAPQSTGYWRCSIDTGHEGCDSVICEGVGGPPISAQPSTWGSIKSTFR
jgi:hypothetical protein